MLPLLFLWLFFFVCLGLLFFWGVVVTVVIFVSVILGCFCCCCFTILPHGQPHTVLEDLISACKPNIETVSKAMLGKRKRNGVERMLWAFPSA